MRKEYKPRYIWKPPYLVTFFRSSEEQLETLFDKKTPTEIGPFTLQAGIYLRANLSQVGNNCKPVTLDLNTY